LEFLFQFLGEMLLQACFELLAELGFRGLANTVRRPRSPALSTIGFILWGMIAGGLSLLIFPASPIDNPVLRRVNLIATPVAVGLVMVMIGRIRRKRGQNTVRLDHFGYAFTFAFSMALVRFIWAQ